MGSPYPLSYDLRWPWLHLRPSTREHVSLPREPLQWRADDAPSPTARIVCFGDLMGLTGDRVPQIHAAIAARLEAADLVIGNCESPVIDAPLDPRAFYLQSFRMPTAYLREALARLHVDPARCVLSVANNHSGDLGVAGLHATLEQFAALGVTPVGLVDAPLAMRRVRGLRVGIAAWTQWMNREAFTPTTGVSRSADARDHDWLRLRRVHAVDTLLATPHWDWEFQHHPAAATVAAAHALAPAFDAIAGHHPHVVQPLARFGDSLCLFSLGNLMARTLTWPHRLSLLWELEVALAGAARGRVVGYTCHPLAQLDDSIVPLAAASARYRERMQRRLALLFA